MKVRYMMMPNLNSGTYDVLDVKNQQIIRRGLKTVDHANNLVNKMNTYSIGGQRVEAEGGS
jgi:hypothetical protein